jgi:hypothetical protein
MNMDRIERRLLLAASGELSARQRRQLERAAARHPWIGERADALRRLAELTRAGLSVPLTEVPAVPVRDLLAECASARPAPLRCAGSVGRPWPHWARACAAAAAVLALAACAWLLRGGAGLGADALDELRTLVAIVSPHHYVAEADNRAADTELIRELARHLLLMEGFAGDGLNTEAATFLDDAPTTLRWRSSDESLPERYG